MIGLIGINHQRADVTRRSAFALSPAEASMIVEDWIACSFVKGAVILSTCNRVEIYYEVDSDAPHGAEQRLIHSLLNNLELSQKYAELLEAKQGREVYQHLFRLASGLESVVVGETQILGQLKEAYRMSSLAGHCSGVLSRLFHRAFEVAKRIRSEYILSSTPISAGSAAVDKLYADGHVPQRALIVGAGLMADTVYNHLIHRGATDIVVYNRTKERAERFQEEHPKASIAYESSLEAEVHQADTIIVATSAPSPIILKEQLLPEYGSKYIVDLAVPRNVSPEVDSLDHITLYTIDELENLGAIFDTEESTKIEAIISEYVQLHEQWMDGAQMREVIGLIQKATTLLKDKEVEHSRSMLTTEEQLLISQWDEHFRTTLSTAMIAALREVSGDGRKHRYVDALQAIFTTVCNRMQDQ